MVEGQQADPQGPRLLYKNNVIVATTVQPQYDASGIPQSNSLQGTGLAYAQNVGDMSVNPYYHFQQTLPTRNGRKISENAMMVMDSNSDLHSGRNRSLDEREKHQAIR